MKKIGNILIISDHSDLLELLTFDLGQIAEQVFTASSGRNALSILDRNLVHTILLDDQVMGDQLFEFIERIQQNFGKIPILLLSTHQRKKKLEPHLNSLITTILEKPYRAGRLQNLVRGMVENKVLQ